MAGFYSIDSLRLWQHYLLASCHLCILFCENVPFLPWWEYQWFVTETRFDFRRLHTDLSKVLSHWEAQLLQTSFGLSFLQCWLLFNSRRFTETGCWREETVCWRPATVLCNIPLTLYHSKQLEEFSRFAVLSQNILYLIKCFLFSNV